MIEIVDILRALPHLHNPSNGEIYPELEFFNANNCYPYYVRAAEAIKPRRILEIGSLLGFGLVSFLEGYPECQEIISVDNESYIPCSRKLCLENLEAARRISAAWDGRAGAQSYPDISFYAHSAEVIRRSNGVRHKFDLIHVDGDHSYEGAIADMLFAWSLKPRVMLVDDYHSMDSVRAAVASWSRYYDIPYKVWDSYRGWAVFALDASEFARLPDKIV